MLGFESTSSVDMYLLHCPCHVQPFLNHHLPLSPRPPKEERTPRYEYLAGLAYHIHRGLPSC